MLRRLLCGLLVASACLSSAQINDWSFTEDALVVSTLGVKLDHLGRAYTGENGVGGVSGDYFDFYELNLDGSIRDSVRVDGRHATDAVKTPDGVVHMLVNTGGNVSWITLDALRTLQGGQPLNGGGIAGSLLDIGGNRVAITEYDSVSDFEKIHFANEGGLLGIAFLTSSATGHAPVMALSDDSQTLVGIGSEQIVKVALSDYSSEAASLPVGSKIVLTDISVNDIWAVGVDTTLDGGDWRIYRWDLDDLELKLNVRLRGAGASIDIPNALVAVGTKLTVVGNAGTDGMIVRADSSTTGFTKKIDPGISWRSVVYNAANLVLGGLSTSGSDAWILQEETVNGFRQWRAEKNPPAGYFADDFVNLVSDPRGGIIAAGTVRDQFDEPLSHIQRYFRVQAPLPGISESGATFPVVVNLNEPAPRAITIQIQGTEGATTPASVTIPALATFAVIQMRSPNTHVSKLCGIELDGMSLDWNSYTNVIPVRVAAISINPTSVFSGGSVTGSVVLSGPSPANGSIVALTDNSGLATTPASVYIPPGQTNATFNITTFVSRVDQTISVTASLNYFPISSPFDLKRSTLQTVEIGPTSVIGGTPANAVVKVNGLAAESNIVTMSSSNIAAATVPSQVVIVKGQYQAAFNVTTKGVKVDTLVTITGSMNSITATDTITVKAAKLVSVTLPATVPGGGTATGTLLCDGIMPPGGTPNTVALTDNSALLTTPASATIPILTTGTTFTVTALPVAANTNSTVSAAFRGLTKTATITIQRAAIESIQLSAEAVNGGTPVTITVRLSAAAPTGGAAVTLQSSNAALLSVPATVTVPAGLKSFSFVRTAGATTTTQTVTLSAIRFGTKTATLTVVP